MARTACLSGLRSDKSARGPHAAFPATCPPHASQTPRVPSAPRQQVVGATRAGTDQKRENQQCSVDNRAPHEECSNGIDFHIVSPSSCAHLTTELTGRRPATFDLNSRAQPPLRFSVLLDAIRRLPTPDPEVSFRPIPTLRKSLVDPRHVLFVARHTCPVNEIQDNPSRCLTGPLCALPALKLCLPIGMDELRIRCLNNKSVAREV